MLPYFHRLGSTLLGLVGAFLVEVVGVRWLLGHYGEAIERGYRFYSFGDAMLILPD
jgi:S-adenosylmethionine:tRNA ribosyltransferase-isomerase